jgi:hypothetical protein
MFATEAKPMQALRSHGCPMQAYIIIVIVVFIIKI